MSSEPRAPKDWEFPNIVKFLDENLRPQEAWSITSEYPTAFSLSNRPNIRIINDGDKIISHALTKFMLIKSPMGLFKVAGIGSVVTDPQYRNQGYSSKVIDSCIESAAAADCDFAILWTNLFDFYRKKGFELAGREHSFLINKQLDSQVTNLKILDTKKIDPNALLNLFNKHTVSSIRTATDIQSYLEIPNSNLFTAWSHDNKLLAYAIEGKGSDLKSYIHEWGGGVEELLYLFSCIYTRYTGGITVITPEHSQNLNSRLKSAGAIHHDGALGMIKIINKTHIAFKLHRYARAIGIDNFIAQEDSGKFVIGVGKNIYTIDDDKDLVSLLFNPNTLENAKNLDSETKEKLSSIFPLAMWVWGWDSV